MRNEIIVQKLLKFIDKVQKYTAAENSESFSKNTMLQEACVFCLIQIGELVYKMDDDFKVKYPEIPWSQIAGLRHHIVHDYDGIKLDRIWDTIENHIPDFKSQLEGILRR